MVLGKKYKTQKEMKTNNMKRKRVIRKYHIKKKENLDQVIKQLKQKSLATMQQLSRYRKRQKPILSE